MGGSLNQLISALGTHYYTKELKGVAHLNVHTHAHFTRTLFFYFSNSIYRKGMLATSTG